MAELPLINCVVKSTVQLLLIDPQSKTPRYLGSGCIIKLKNKVYLISVAHVTDHDGLETSIISGQPPVNGQSVFYTVGAMNYIDEFKVVNFDDISKIQDFSQLDFEKIETLDITFVELKNEMEIFQNKMDFGLDWGVVSEGTKLMLCEPDLSRMPSIDKGYLFFGHVNGNIVGNLIVSQPKLSIGLEYVQSNEKYHIFRFPENITNADDFVGTSGAPIFDEDGYLVALVAHCIEGYPFIFGFRSDLLQRFIEFAVQSEQ